MFALFAIAIMPGVGRTAGLLTPAGSSLPDLQIESHQVSVLLEDGYAITTVEQVFSNPHTQDLEAIYSFPLPEKAAVAEFTVWIDGKPVSGEVLPKQQAKQVYETEKAAGREAGLMEKDTFKTFDIKVSPVRASSDVKIRFAYIQPAHVDTGMGRYVYPLEEGGVDEQKLNFWTANELVQRNFSFNLKLKSDYPVDALRMPNQPQAQIVRNSAEEWQADLFSSNSQQMEEQSTTQLQQNQPAFTLDKDIVVYWRHQANLPGSVDLVTYKPQGSSKGTFMLTLTPGDDLQPIAEGSDWVFILDISGSMQGKYATLVDGVNRALGKMRGVDRFRIVLFNDSSRELTNGFVNATTENIQHYSQLLLQVHPASGTHLYAGLQKGLSGIDADRTSAIVLVTDGVANIGEVRQRKFIDLIKTRDIRLFTFIMGNSANRPMLKALTKASNGFAVNISSSDDIVGKLLEATSKVTHESLHGVKLSISGVKIADTSPKQLASLYRGQQMIVFGHYWGSGSADIKLSGKISGQDKAYATGIEFPQQSELNPEIERLWAYASIEDMMNQIQDFGEDADLKQAITDLSVEYGLVTDYTSMLVVRDEVFDALGIKRQNKKRLQAETEAKQNRAANPVVSNRVDTQQPMFQSSRASHDGGGSFGAGLLITLGLLVLISRQLKNRQIQENIKNWGRTNGSAPFEKR
ncbi:MAG: VWA domain-containing protein [Gammaproteobacteria bacterium]|nr:VWA domain-containing protein [Gammaproteobacteria bacterium]